MLNGLYTFIFLDTTNKKVLLGRETPVQSDLSLWPQQKMDLGLCVQKLKVLLVWTTPQLLFQSGAFFPSTQYSFGFKAKWQSCISRDELPPALYNSVERLLSDFEIEISKTGEVNWRQQVWTTLSRTFAIKESEKQNSNITACMDMHILWVIHKMGKTDDARDREQCWQLTLKQCTPAMIPLEYRN